MLVSDATHDVILASLRSSKTRDCRDPSNSLPSIKLHCRLRSGHFFHNTLLKISERLQPTCMELAYFDDLNSLPQVSILIGQRT